MAKKKRKKKKEKVVTKKVQTNHIIMKIILIVTLWSALSIASAAGRDAKLASEYTVNLDLLPAERWTEIVSEYKSDIENILKLIKKDVPQVLAEAISVVAGGIDELVPHPYNEEIVGIAGALNTSVADILLANLYYELTAYNHRHSGNTVLHSLSGCTSIVAETTDGGIMHARNMDYSFVKYLENITITVHFQKGGKTVYTGTTFTGYVGLVTGQKPYKYTISLDERNQGTLEMNLAEMLLSRGMKGAVAFHVREVLNSDDLTFSEAVEHMAGKLLTAPVYVIMGGANSGEGVVITRNRLDALDRHWLNATAGTWYVLETNYDRWTTPPPDDDRRDPAIRAMNDMTRAGVTVMDLFNVLSTPPVFNHKTTYTVVMAAAQPEIYKTWVRFYGS